jgi:hypothetical protein
MNDLAGFFRRYGRDIGLALFLLVCVVLYACS